MKPIGGYFELELRKGEEYHKNALRLNLGRNAFEYILRAKAYKKIFLPYYTCQVMLDPINKLELAFQFYQINRRFEPIFNFKDLNPDESFVFTNYFGLYNHIVKKLSLICPNLIIDNSQAFFAYPIEGIDTLYSPRKFFGIPDGAYLYTDASTTIDLEKDNSIGRFMHLIRRIEEGAEAGYMEFKNNDNALVGQPIKQMSSLTQALLCNIDYNESSRKRKENFLFVHHYLGKSNKIEIPDYLDSAPMIYPFLSTNRNLKQILIQNKIFVPTFWPNVLEWCSEFSIEYNFARNLIPLPIDQRYSNEDLKIIIDLILKHA